MAKDYTQAIQETSTALARALGRTPGRDGSFTLDARSSRITLEPHAHGVKVLLRVPGVRSPLSSDLPLSVREAAAYARRLSRD